jgi:hypothetical protein
MRGMRRAGRLVAGLAVAAVLLGCGGDGATGPTPTDQRAALAGTWTLQTVNGQPLPVRLPDGSGRSYDLYDGRLELNVTVSGNVMRLHYRYVGAAFDTYENQEIGWGPNPNGTVAINILLGSGAVLPNTATVQGNTMTLPMTNPFGQPARTYVYTR